MNRTGYIDVDKLQGTEFQRVKNILARKMESATKVKPNPSTHEKAVVETSGESSRSTGVPTPVNVPLIDSSDERVRELHNIDLKLVTDIAKMNLTAAAYVRCHPCLTSESMKKWRCGYLPNDGGGDKRGWSLRGQII